MIGVWTGPALQTSVQPATGTQTQIKMRKFYKASILHHHFSQNLPNVSLLFLIQQFNFHFFLSGAATVIKNRGGQFTSCSALCWLPRSEAGRHTHTHTWSRQPTAGRAQIAQLPRRQRNGFLIKLSANFPPHFVLICTSPETRTCCPPSLIKE